MLLLLFKTGEDRYAIDTQQIIEIIPLVHLKKLPKSPEFILGIFNYRGRPTPVLDICQFTSNRFCADSISTRIILAEFSDHEGNSRPIGIKAEQVNETLKCEPEEFLNIGVELAESPYLGAIRNDSKGMIQFIRTSNLIPKEARKEIFGLIDEPSKNSNYVI